MHKNHQNGYQGLMPHHNPPPFQTEIKSHARRTNRKPVNHRHIRQKNALSTGIRKLPSPLPTTPSTLQLP